MKDAIGVPSYENEVRGCIPRSGVIWGQVRWKMLVFVIWFFKKLKSEWNQTCIKDAVGVPLNVNEAKVMYQGQGSSEVKLGGKCKIVYFFWKVEVQLQPNLICRCNMWISYSVSEWGLFKLSCFELFLCELLWYWSSLQVMPPCQRDYASLLAVLFFKSGCQIWCETVPNPCLQGCHGRTTF